MVAAATARTKLSRERERELNHHTQSFPEGTNPPLVQTAESSALHRITFWAWQLHGLPGEKPAYCRGCSSSGSPRCSCFPRCAGLSVFPTLVVFPLLCVVMAREGKSHPMTLFSFPLALPQLLLPLECRTCQNALLQHVCAVWPVSLGSGTRGSVTEIQSLLFTSPS